MVNGNYPPRIELEFRLAAADGTLIRAGRRTLFDIDYRLNHPEAQLSRDPLRYEKPLVAQWLAVELAPAARAGSAPVNRRLAPCRPRLFDFAKDAVQLLKARVVDDDATRALAAGVDLYLGAEGFREFRLEARSVRVMPVAR